VPDTRQHRGPHPEDHRQFSSDKLPGLRHAVEDYCWLLTRGYAETATLKLVGDRYKLTARQRQAVMRSSCSDQSLALRVGKQATREQLAGRRLLIDGFNVLTTVEAALAGGLVLVGRDGCFRDLASMHGNYRKVAETVPAVNCVGSVLKPFEVSKAVWYLDRPVSNSGRLAGIIRSLSAEQGWPWEVELVDNPDVVLTQTADIVASADSVVIGRCVEWFNLARAVIEGRQLTSFVLRFD